MARSSSPRRERQQKVTGIAEIDMMVRDGEKTPTTGSELYMHPTEKIKMRCECSRVKEINIRSGICEHEYGMRSLTLMLCRLRLGIECARKIASEQSALWQASRTESMPPSGVVCATNCSKQISIAYGCRSHRGCSGSLLPLNSGPHSDEL